MSFDCDSPVKVSENASSGSSKEFLEDSAAGVPFFSVDLV